MRNKMFFCILLLMFIYGCGGMDEQAEQRREFNMTVEPYQGQLPRPSGGMILSINADTISADDIVKSQVEKLRPLAANKSFESFAKQASPAVGRVVVEQVREILLQQQARKSLGGNIDEEALDRIIDKEVARFIDAFDGDRIKAQQELQKMGWDWQGFRKYQKKLIISRSYLSSEVTTDPGPISHSQLLDYYEEVKDAFFATSASIEFRLIDISKENPEAMKLAKELIFRLNSGEDFAQLATAYSDGHRALRGGLWDPVEPDSLAEPYDKIIEAVENLSPDQIAGPVETEKHVFIVKLQSSQKGGYEPFQKVQQQVEARVAFEHRKKEYENFMQKLISQAEIGNTNSFIQFCLIQIYEKAQN